MISKTEASKADIAGGYVGEKMLQVFNNYFGDEKVLKAFTTGLEVIVQNFPKNRPINVLDIGANNGVLGEYVSRYLAQRGIGVELTISDCNQSGLQDNQNSKTIKVCSDNKHLPFKDKSFDLVLARSVLQYEGSLGEISQAISEVKRVLRPESYFANQAAIFTTRAECEILSKINLLVNKPVTLQTKKEVEEMLNQYFSGVWEYGQIPGMCVTDEGFIQRYGLEEQREAITLKINHIILDQHGYFPNIFGSFFDTHWKIPYALYLCKK